MVYVSIYSDIIQEALPDSERRVWSHAGHTPLHYLKPALCTFAQEQPGGFTGSSCRQRSIFTRMTMWTLLNDAKTYDVIHWKQGQLNSVSTSSSQITAECVLRDLVETNKILVLSWDIRSYATKLATRFSHNGCKRITLIEKRAESK